MSSSSRRSSTSSASSGLYVPVHKRDHSGSSSSGSRSTSPASSTRSVSPSNHEQTLPTTQSRIYTPATLLFLAQSPLSRLSPETREAIRENVPQIVMNRRQRKSLEHANGSVQRITANANVKPVAVAPAPTMTAAPRRRPAGRVNERRRIGAFASKVVDNASWRGRRPASAAINIPMSVVV